MPHKTFFRNHLTGLTRTFLPTAGAILPQNGSPDQSVLVQCTHQIRRVYVAETSRRWAAQVGSAFGKLSRALTRAFGSLTGRLWDLLERADRSRREAWLAQSTDVHDLEQRIRERERAAVRGTW